MYKQNKTYRLKLLDAFLMLFIFGIFVEQWELFGSESNLSLSKITGYIYILYSLISKVLVVNYRIYKSSLILLFVFFTFYNLSIFNNIEFLAGLDTVFSIRLAQNIFFFVLITNHIIKHPTVINKILFSIMFSVMLLGLLSFFGIGKGEELINELPVRATFFDENPNTFGNKAVMAFAISIYFLFTSNYRLLVKILILAAMIVYVFMVIESASRGALIALAMISITSLYYVKLSIFKKSVLIILFLFISSYFISYLERNSDSLLIYLRLSETIEEGNLGGRDMLVKNAINGFFEKPIMGVSRIPLADATSIYRDPHNVFLAVLLASGLMGFIPFLIFNIQIMLKSYKIYVNTKSFLYIVMYVLIFFIMLKQGGFINSKLLWLNYAIISGMYYHSFKKQMIK